MGPRLNIFPPSGEKSRDIHDPTHYEVGWTNYDSVEHDPAAAAEVKKLADSAYVDTYDSYEELLRWRFSEPIISRLKIITKTVGERTKRRLIMGCLMSGANGKTLQQCKHTNLPAEVKLQKHLPPD